MTYFYCKSGKIYLGGLFTTLVATWIATGAARSEVRQDNSMVKATTNPITP